MASRTPGYPSPQIGPNSARNASSAGAGSLNSRRTNRALARPRGPGSEIADGVLLTILVMLSLPERRLCGRSRVVRFMGHRVGGLIAFTRRSRLGLQQGVCHVDQARLRSPLARRADGWRVWSSRLFSSPDLETKLTATEVARRCVRYWAISIAAGAAAGVTVIGAGGRLAMRLLAVTASDDAQGRITEADTKSSVESPAMEPVISSCSTGSSAVRFAGRCFSWSDDFCQPVALAAPHSGSACCSFSGP